MLYPLKFHAIYKDYFWGGRELEKLGKELPQGVIAESWEISSHPDGESQVSMGEYAGSTLCELTKRLGVKLVGDDLDEKHMKKFPFLIKLIDANKKLSVQVHPKDEYATVNEGGELGKNEMWYIISAKPGAKIVHGIKPYVTKEIFINSINENKIENCLNYLEVFPGDAVNIPAGLIHSIGEGIMLVEIQQNSNTTYRVFDYDRVDLKGNKRELHIKKALDVIDFNNFKMPRKQKGLQIMLKEHSYKIFLVANQYFSVEKYVINGSVEEYADGKRFFTYTCIEGQGEINYLGGRESISKGQSVFIPAALGSYTLEGKLELIKAYVPDIDENIINPLLKAGYNIELIKNNVIG